MSRQANPVPVSSSALPRAVRIGIFDSGVGGLSVMQAIRARLPHAELLYAADTAHAPYGDRSEAFLCDRSERIARFLCDQGAQMIVVACNTATAAAVARLRAASPTLAVVGVEPGVKPAVALSAARRIGVLATTRTLASEKFRKLAEAHADGATLVLQPCPGLADAIETADAQGSGLDALVERYSAPLRAAGVDVAVLGCTHYVFARELFERALPGRPARSTPPRPSRARPPASPTTWSTAARRTRPRPTARRRCVPGAAARRMSSPASPATLAGLCAWTCRTWHC